METTLPLAACITLTLACAIAAFLAAWLVQMRRLSISRNKWQEHCAQQHITLTSYQELKQELSTAQEEHTRSTGEIARLTTSITFLQEQQEALKQEKAEVLTAHQAQFQVLAGGLAEKFVRSNADGMQTLIAPVQKALDEFGRKVEESYGKSLATTSGLREVIDLLTRQSSDISEQARDLAAALRGDPQVQGTWGEYQLERLLELSGLQSGVHYVRQETHKTDNGQSVRPDFLVCLPQDKHLILDAKVSLTAFEQYCHADTEEDRVRHARDHVRSVHTHLRTLGSKGYQSLAGLHTPEYVLMFMPVEHAFLLVLREDPALFEKALRQQIVIVSPGTLLATLRTVAAIWRQEDQERNAQEIARQAGHLIDKFAGFTSELDAIAKGIETTRTAYNKAVNKLYDSKKYGDTVFGRLEKLRDMGVQSARPLVAAKQVDK